MQKLHVIWKMLIVGVALAYTPLRVHAQEQHDYTDLVRIVEVTLSQPSDVDRLNDAGLVVSNVQDDRATLYVFEEQLALLRSLGFTPVPATQPKLDEKHLSAYHTHDQLTTDLQAYVNAHPDIARLQSVGLSVQGRELWALRITDNPDAEEVEPEFRYISTIHGDEKVGTETCLYFIDLLLNEYGVTPRITNLVNETEIWIMPMMNPDGSTSHQRFNANGVDLNRNFPNYPNEFTGTIFDQALDVSGKQIEVQHVAQWSAAQSFVLSANFHGGALVVNYPYDYDQIPSGQDAPTPDDLLIEEISLAYSIHNTPMYNSPTFDNGIINGTAWYSITGGMQDWNYRYVGCIDLTIELGNTKTPAASAIPQYWADNEESMLSLMEQVHKGVRGTVTDRNTGGPLWVQVNIDVNDQPVFSDPDVGDYYRLLLPGVYVFQYFADGYIPYTVEDVEVLEGAAATRQNVTLSDGDLNNDGAVNAVDVQLSVNALLGYNIGLDADVDGRGLSATDLQHVVNRSIGVR